jgi:flagellar motor switch protein FliG
MAARGQQSDRLSSKQKAAMLILSLDVDTATKVLRQFSQAEVEALMLEVTNLKGMQQPQMEDVVEEFERLVKSGMRSVGGGPEYAKRLLEKSLGPGKAAEISDRIRAKSPEQSFGALKKADARQVANFLVKEHPQTVALILTNLSPEQTGAVLNEFTEELRNDIMYRIATLGKVSPTLLAEMEQVVEAMSLTEVGQPLSAAGGARSVAAILNAVPGPSGKAVLGHIESIDPQLASDVKRLMFTFEDMLAVDDRGIQRVLREVDKKDLALSLKIASDAMKEKIFGNMSERARDLLQEELGYLGPVRLKEVEAAQGRIVDVVKQLEEQGEVVMSGRGGSEDVVV